MFVRGLLVLTLVLAYGDGATVKIGRAQSPNLYVPTPNVNEAVAQNLPNLQEVTKKLDEILAEGGGRGSITYCPNPQTCITRVGQEEASNNRQSSSGDLDPNQFDFVPSRTPGSQSTQGFSTPYFPPFNRQPFQGFNTQPFQGFNYQPFQGFNPQPFQGFNFQPFNFPQFQQPLITFPSIIPFVSQPFPFPDLGADGKKNGTFSLGNTQGTFYTLGGPGQAGSTTVIVGTFGDKGTVRPRPPAPSPTEKPSEETPDVGVVKKEVVVETVEEVVRATTFPPELIVDPRIRSKKTKRAAPQPVRRNLIPGFPSFSNFPNFPSFPPPSFPPPTFSPPSFPPIIAPTFPPIPVPEFPEVVDNKDGTFSVGDLNGTYESSTIEDKGGKPSGTVVQGTFGDKEHGFGTFVQHVSNGGTVSSISSSYSSSYPHEPKKDDEEETAEAVKATKETKSKSKVSSHKKE